jgi:pimeloyl-ACP methyl ester carboxylesterase
MFKAIKDGVTDRIQTQVLQSKQMAKVRYRALSTKERLAAKLHELYAVCLAAVLFPLAWLPLKHRVRKVQGDTAYLMVHGYLHNRTAWTFATRMFDEAGLGPVYTVDLPQPFTSIHRDLRPLLWKKIDQIYRETGVKRLCFVTHSMGGVVTLTALLDRPHELPVEIGSVEMLCPPLKGSNYLRQILIGECRKEILPESALLNDLYRRIQEECNINMHSYVSLYDDLVDPESASLDPDRTTYFKHTGHVGVLFSEDPLKQVIDRLRSQEAALAD